MQFFGKKKKSDGKNEKQKTNVELVGNILTKGMVSVKDIVAPSFVEVDFNYIKIDEKFYRTLFVVGYPRYVSPNWLSSLIAYDHPLYISTFIYPTESAQILKDLRRKIAEMEATIESDIKAGKVVDPTVQVSLDDALTLQAELAQGSERFFQFAFYITIPADSEKELDRLESAIASLDTGQGEAQLRKNLKEVKTHYENWKRLVKDANFQQAIEGIGKNTSGNRYTVKETK